MTKMREEYKEEVHMQTHRAVKAAITGCIALFLYLIIVPAAQAEIFYDVAIKATYEDLSLIHI